MALGADANRMFDSIPANGKPIGNSALRKKLGLGDEPYWQVRQELLDAGKVRLARGRGGSVYRLKQEDITDVEAGGGGTQYADEQSIYEPFMTCLRTSYLRDIEITENFVVQKTALQGRRDTGGIWTRPDVVILYVESFPYLPGRVLTIESFEVKTADALDVKAVYEAAAHGRFANYPYLAFYLPDGVPEDSVFERIESECDRFDVGLIWLKDPADYASYEFIRDPERHQPDPIEQNDFIDIQIDQENKAKIVSWVK